MAAPTRVTVTTQTAAGWTASGYYTVTIPSATEGNLLFLLAMTGDDTASPIFSTATSGFTEINEVGNNGGNICGCVAAAYWYEVPATPPATMQLDTTGISEYLISVWVEVNGADTTTPIHKSPFNETTGGGQATLPVLGDTTTIADCYVLAFTAITDASDVPYVVSGTGWTERVNENFTGQGYEVGGIVADKTMSGTGATGTMTVTPTTNAEGAWGQIAIAPPGAGSGAIHTLAGGGGLAGPGGIAGSKGGLAN